MTALHDRRAFAGDRAANSASRAPSSDRSHRRSLRSPLPDDRRQADGQLSVIAAAVSAIARIWRKNRAVSIFAALARPVLSARPNPLTGGPSSNHSNNTSERTTSHVTRRTLQSHPPRSRRLTDSLLDDRTQRDQRRDHARARLVLRYHPRERGTPRAFALGPPGPK